MATPTGGSGINLTFGKDDDGVCNPLHLPMRWSDMFAWLQYAKPAGQKIVRGETCSVWSLRLTKPLVMNASICVGSDSLPREFNQSIGGPGSAFSSSAFMQFFNATAEDPGEAAFAPTKACDTHYPTKPCPDGKVIKMDTYRIWSPPEPFELANRDTGDVMGDLSFVCTQGSGAAYKSKVISQWSVEVSSAFGQYAFCNFNGTANVCTGRETQLTSVGRRSGQFSGKGPLLGQCSVNDDTGSQYSFPGTAQCPPGVSPGAATNCAWGNAVPVRTLAAICVMQERGLLDACKRGIGHAPFEEAIGIWKKAFASADASLGGCPDVPTTADKDIQLLV
mmetsp:Transcript_57218/g.185979  ORF Transcript_57218/g.185979 Transcript_57218/m.185979 type:complete len:335 (+) Transcript_57218:107-1111(+)